jgi:hypothetical protein
MPEPKSTSTKLWINLRPDIFEYFFRKVFAGDWGIKQKLVNAMFEKLYDECIRRGISPEWDPENGAAVDAVLNDMHFNEQRKPRKSSSTRRAPRGTAKLKAQPDGSANEPGPAHRASHQAPHPGDEPPNSVSQA